MFDLVALFDGSNGSIMKFSLNLGFRNGTAKKLLIIE